MNTRALMELIVLNIGKDLGLLPTDIFSMLVSTFMGHPADSLVDEGAGEPGHAGGRAIRGPGADVGSALLDRSSVRGRGAWPSRPAVW
jgi:hypothetical protein